MEHHHHKRLELEYVCNLLRQEIEAEKEEIEISEIIEEPGSGRGDNYTSMLYRLGVNGRKRDKTNNWIPWKTSIIYKVLPESKAHREAFKSELLFRNEVAFYNNVWPALEQLVDKTNAAKIVFNGVAKIYVATSDLIVMEDLKRKGYIMADRRKGLELDRLKLVLKALAGFHALSLTLRDLRPEVFEKLADENNSEGIRETLFRIENEDWYRNYYRVAAKNAINMLSEALPASQEDKRQEAIEKLQAFLHEDVFFRTMCDLASTRGPLTVFCHGDCWTNNFLFSNSTKNNNININNNNNDNSNNINNNNNNNNKNNSSCHHHYHQTSIDNQQEAVYLVDFQLMRVGSVALDLTNLLYCCTSAQVRKVHMTSLLLHYHTHLMDALHKLNPAGTSSRDSSVTWELLNEEIRKCGRFGLGLALDILPCSTCDSDNAPDLYEGADGEGKAMRAPPPGGKECARLMTDLVLELINNNAL